MGQQAGLRFDIYERVYLAEETEEIRNLEEIELVPDIELHVQDTKALLSGHLKLTGSYSSHRSEEQQQLEHLIPVEITLPLNRMNDANQIGVEIENFDVEVLSARSLNVTGVLSLSGLALNRPSEVNWTTEEEVFVHEANQNKEEVPEQKNANVQVQNEAQSAVEAVDTKETAELLTTADIAASEPVETELEMMRGGISDETVQANTEKENTPVVRSEPQVQEVREDLTQETSAAESVSAESGDSSEEVEREENAAEDQQEATVASASAEPEEELKIAFSKKENDESNAFSKHLKSILKRPEAETANAAGNLELEAGVSPDSASEAETAEQQREEEQSEQHSENGLEWKKLFLSREDEEQNQFSRLKMCIVQKEETLETIAERYEINPREILLYNRMNDQTGLSEGQIIYIPQVQK